MSQVEILTKHFTVRSIRSIGLYFAVEVVVPPVVTLSMHRPASTNVVMDLRFEHKDKDSWSKDKDLVVRGRRQGLEVEVQGQEQGLVVRRQGQGLVNWSSRILEDKDFSRGQQHWIILVTLKIVAAPSAYSLTTYLHRTVLLAKRDYVTFGYGLPNPPVCRL